MTPSTFTLIERHMLSNMQDSAHDKEHIYRVLYLALDIAKTESSVDYDVLICACLLHDIGRKEQFENPSLCHAQVGGEKAYQFLTAHGFTAEFAENVKTCIQAHRFRKNCLPQTLEAKILFDADKIDVSGALGIARTLLYTGQVSEPLYSLLPDGQISDGENDASPSFFQEYKHKLENLYSHFYTKRGMELACQRQEAAKRFYEDILQEAKDTYKHGLENLNEILEKQ